MFDRLRTREASGETIQVAVVGAGFVARGLIHQLELTPGMRLALIVAREPNRAVKVLADNGIEAASVVSSDDPAELVDAILTGRVAVTRRPEILSGLTPLDVVVEATGDVEYGARVAVAAIRGGHHVVSLNYETDATVGPILASWARQRGVVYTGSDGDQPGVMKRLAEYVEGIGLVVVAAVNCKGFLDTHATPDSIREWALKQNTSLHMTTAFTDGTKMNVENVSVANATGLVPARRGMIGIQTDLANAVEDFRRVLDREGVVDFTLGGDFGSGVFVIGSGADPELAAPYLQYLKMGTGPWYLFFRPWHLVQFETPLSIAEAVLDGRPTIAPTSGPLAQAVTIAKRDLDSGTKPDGIGGYDIYGEIDLIEDSSDLVPIGLAAHGTLTSSVEADRPVESSHFELDDESPLVRLWSWQDRHFGGDPLPDIADTASMWRNDA